MSVDHYENFPVASILCPPALRPTVAAIYGFARTADDIADEGSSSSTERLATLDAYRADLEACFGGSPVSGRWASVFGALGRAIMRDQLPRQPLRDLLDAFSQDARNPPYESRDELLDYCRRSANPVGRLLLHLYRIDDDPAKAQSDAVCSALQLINFWQDLSVDLPRQRVYVPLADLRAHGLRVADLREAGHAVAVRPLVRDLCRWAGDLMRRGAPLALRVPGRAGWELRLVVQGGFRILDRIEAIGWDTVRQRPTLTRTDGLRLVWRAMTMTQR